MTISDLRMIYPCASFCFFRDGMETEHVGYHDAIESYEYKNIILSDDNGAQYEQETVFITLPTLDKEKASAGTAIPD